jgi:hypothetical protein
MQSAKPLTMEALYRAWLKWRGRTDPTDAIRGVRVLPRVLDWAGRGQALRDRVVAEVTTADIEAFRAWRSASGRRPRVLGLEIVMLRRLFNFAVARGDIPVSPMRLMLLPLWSRRVKASAPRVQRSHARPQSLGNGQLTLAEVLEVDELTTELWAEGNWAERPRTRAGCLPVGEPCPFASCRHNLAVEVEGTLVKLNHPGRDLGDLRETCSLRVADGPGVTVEEAGELLNLTDQSIRDIELRALAKLRSAGAHLSPA